MYVMSVKDALEMTEMRHHQVLVREGKVIRCTQGMMIIFLSHQWLGLAHPDRNMIQFRTLQQALENLMTGKVAVKLCPFFSVVFKQLKCNFDQECVSSLGDAYIWYDYFCVPQLTEFLSAERGACLAQDHRNICLDGSDAGVRADALGKSRKEVQEQQRAAIKSIPHYVQFCDHFFAVAPAACHDDTKQSVSLESWARRGWCRAEMGCHYLSKKARPSMIFITKEDRVIETYPFAWLHNQPVQGEFACEADREFIGEMMADLCQNRIEYLRQTGQEFEPRFLTAMLPWLAPGMCMREDDLNSWLRAYGFRDHKEAGNLGWAPIHFAALEGNISILDKLVDLGELVTRKTAEGDPPPLGVIDIGMQIPGMTPLMCAAFYIPVGASSVKVAHFLLQHQADINATCAGGETALHMAAAGAASDGMLVKFLVDSKADIESLNDARETPLLKASFICPAGSKFPNKPAIRQLVEQGAKLSGASSIRPLQHSALKAVAGTGGVDELRFLLTSRACINGSQDYKIKPVDIEMSGLPEEIRESCIKDSVPHLYGGTPLHWATYFGNVENVNSLLALGADPLVKNEMGRTPRDVAEHEAQEECLRTFELHSMRLDPSPAIGD